MDFLCIDISLQNAFNLAHTHTLLLFSCAFNVLSARISWSIITSGGHCIVMLCYILWSLMKGPEHYLDGESLLLEGNEDECFIEHIYGQVEYKVAS